MTTFKLYQVDAFATEIFRGNPAAVMPVTDWFSDDIMQKLAVENNLSETAFYKPSQSGRGFDLRWFTPGFEVDLCGHATLATAHVIFEHQNYPGDEIHFQTRSGQLTVQRTEAGYLMDFPIDELVPHPVPEWAPDALNCPILKTFRGKDDWLVITDTRKRLRR